MLTDNPMDTAKFRCVESSAVGRPDRCHPELRLSMVADDVDMGRLVTVGGISEHSVWTIPQEGGQGGSHVRLE